MIDQMDHFIRTWITGLIPNLAVTIQDPSSLALPDNAVVVRLLEATPTLPPRDAHHPVLQIALTYLISIHHSDIAAAHRLLAELIFSAMQNSAFDVDVEPVPLALWELFHSPPRPALRIRTTIRRERPQRPVHPVLHPLNMEMAPATDLYGLLYGPENQPIAAATIECPALGLYTQTGFDGRFQLPMVPGSNVDLDLVITAKGIDHMVTANAGTTYDKPFVVQIDPRAEAV